MGETTTAFEEKIASSDRLKAIAIAENMRYLLRTKVFCIIIFVVSVALLLGRDESDVFLGAFGILGIFAAVISFLSTFYFLYQLAYVMYGKVALLITLGAVLSGAGFVVDLFVYAHGFLKLEDMGVPMGVFEPKYDALVRLKMSEGQWS